MVRLQRLLGEGYIIARPEEHLSLCALLRA